jgi:uncharacterized membrane protein YvbJ
MKFCPKCGAKVGPDDSNCGSCGKDLDALRKELYDEPIPEREEERRDEPSRAKKRVPSPPPRKDVLKCTFCGANVPSGAERCTYCGTSIAVRSTSASYPCSICGGPLEYIDVYQRWYCPECGRYA